MGHWTLLLVFSIVVVDKTTGSLHPKGAVAGVLQVPPPELQHSPYQFAGVLVPGANICWHAQRRGTILNRVSQLFDGVLDAIEFQESQPYRNDTCKDFLYRVFLVNEANAIKHAAQEKIVTVEKRGDHIVVKRNNFLKRLINNCF